MMLEPFGKGIMGTTLHYPYEIRSEEAVFEEIPDFHRLDRTSFRLAHLLDRFPAFRTEPSSTYKTPSSRLTCFMSTARSL